MTQPDWDVGVTVMNGDWRDSDIETALTAARAALAAESVAEGAEISIAFADDETVRVYNRDYRGKDSPTNVLSFPQGEDAAPDGSIVLGDILLAHETCARESAESGIEFAAHVSHLTVHGVLHLLGYDHEVDEDAEEMEAREVEILAALGIENPYIDREEAAEPA